MHTVTKIKRVTDKQIQMCALRTRSTCMQLAAAGVSRQKGSAVPSRLGIRHGVSPMGTELPKKKKKFQVRQRATTKLAESRGT